MSELSKQKQRYERAWKKWLKLDKRYGRLQNRITTMMYEGDPKEENIVKALKEKSLLLDRELTEAEKAMFKEDRILKEMKRK